jgi:DNA invertase Pin-like site-specific DNA recombinase
MTGTTRQSGHSKAALYARISTDDGRQHTENQELEIEEFCRRRGWQISSRYIDQISGAADTRDRPELLRLFADARRGKFEAVVVWSLDRLTRAGINEALLAIRRLSENGVQFHSVTEPQFSSAGPAGDLLIAIAAWIAQHEREQLVRRIRSGIDRAKAQGKQIGRPFREIDAAKLAELRDQGQSWRQIGKTVGISKSTAARAVRRFEAEKA